MNVANQPRLVGLTQTHIAEREPLPLAEVRQRLGKKMIFAGSIITVLGVILYCTVCFAGGLDASLGDLLFNNSVQFARGTLGILGLGTLIWLAGSFTYLRGAIESDEDQRPPPKH